MSRSRLLPMSAALACLLGSGCDYWKNLTGSKTPDRGTLHVFVTDEWTKEPLPDASCRQAGKGDSLPVGADGVFARPDMPTGLYDLTCRAPGYHDRVVQVDLRPGGMQHHHVKLGRTAEDWYPDNPERAVGIRPLDGSLRFPGNPRLAATPADDTVFTYQWSSSIHSPRTTKSPQVTMETPDLGGQESTLEFSLTVIATLGGKTYPVKTVKETMPLHRNRKPSIDTSSPSGSPIKMGCSEGIKQYTLIVSASDSDGVCKSFSIQNKIAHSSLGPVDIRLDECPHNQIFAFDLKPFPEAPEGSPAFRNNNELLLTAIDDDGAARVDTLRFVTFSNVPPKLAFALEKPPPQLFPKQDLSFRVTASDEDGSLGTITIDWKNGETPTILQQLSGNWDYGNVFANRTWPAAGDYDLTASVVDKCSNQKVTKTLPLTLVPNHLPRITAEPVGFHRPTGEYRIKVSVTDEDALNGFDSVSLFVDWYDINPTILPRKRVYSNETLGHVYDPAKTTRDTLWIRIVAQDMFDGNAFDSIGVARPAALGLNGPAPAGAASR